MFGQQAVLGKVRLATAAPPTRCRLRRDKSPYGVGDASVLHQDLHLWPLVTGKPLYWKDSPIYL